MCYLNRLNMIFNLTTRKSIAYKPFYAISTWHRIRGMIGRDFTASDFDAMVFENCNMIHSCFMSIALDVIFVSRDNIVCGLKENLSPWHPFIRCGNAYFTLELPSGTISRTQTALGNILDLRAELDGQILNEVEKQDFMGTVNVVIPLIDKRD